MIVEDFVSVSHMRNCHSEVLLSALLSQNYLTGMGKFCSLEFRPYLKSPDSGLADPLLGSWELLVPQNTAFFNNPQSTIGVAVIFSSIFLLGQMTVKKY